MQIHKQQSLALNFMMVYLDPAMLGFFTCRGEVDLTDLTYNTSVLFLSGV